MSIPPLVCSTPPPPEQCEEDKDPGDFGIHYNLSQEDEENDFQYDAFSFHHIQSSVASKTDFITTENDPINTIEEIPKGVDNENDQKLHEQLNVDNHIEDLNLDINEETISACVTKSPEDCETPPSEEVLDSVEDTQTNIPIPTNNLCESDSKDKLNTDPNLIESSVLSTPDKSHDILEEPSEDLSVQILKKDDSFIENEVTIPSEGTAKINVETLDDDFDDFDDFQFNNTADKPEILTAPDNPWGSSRSDKIESFTANFDNNQEIPISTNLTEKITFVPSELQAKVENVVVNDDDFGDFDDFQTSSVKSKETEVFQDISDQTVPILNFHSESEYQITDRLNSILYSIFPEEIPEIETGIESKLDAALGEAWAHLKQTDVRQPYIVNWNNSLAQNTLLKSLCIDSRNILFGPKWSSNMPKYATNLSSAPLQPQKQSQQDASPSEQVPSNDKAAKTSWVDPFKADGQESCNVEGDTTVIEAGPTDLDVFEATISPKTSKIYSNTLSIQPIRQINLPDTHIYTPTDSETPRSKTIHYGINTTHTVIPPPVATVKITKEENTPPLTNDAKFEKDDEYWEFQNFKGISAQKDIPKEDDKRNDAPKPNYTFETQVLQPIKVEPLMPTLNWPDPGEVKETFENFSDFVARSASSQNNEPRIEEKQADSKISFDNNIPMVNDINKLPKKASDKFHDDFDMFQSAIPTSKNTPQTQTVSQSENNVDSLSSSIDTELANQKSEHISNPVSKPTASVAPKTSNSITANEFQFKTLPSSSMPVTSNILKPALPTVNSTQQQTQGQILQPLTLESFSQINWPNPGIDLHDLSRFNPVTSLQSLKNDNSRNSSPSHNQKSSSNSQVSDDDIWGDFVSSKPVPQKNIPKQQTTFADDDEWTDYVSSPNMNPQNGLNTISYNVHSNSGLKSSSSSKFTLKNNELPLDIPALNYITPKTNNQKSYSDRHFQNL